MKEHHEYGSHKDIVMFSFEQEGLGMKRGPEYARNGLMNQVIENG